MVTEDSLIDGEIFKEGYKKKLSTHNDASLYAQVSIKSFVIIIIVSINSPDMVLKARHSSGHITSISQ